MVRIPIIVAGAMLDESRFNGIAFVLDIAERKRIQAEIERLAEQRQLALDAARMGWWHYDPITRISSWDDRYKEIFGVTGYQRPNDEILARLHPEDLPDVWAKVEAALDPANPQLYVAEYRINLPDGPMQWIEAHGVAVFEGVGEDRRATNLVGTVADITERKRSESVLQTNLHRFYTILSSMYAGILLVSDNGQIEYSNQAFCDLFDLIDSPEDLVGLTPGEMIEKIKNVYRHPEEAAGPH